MIPKRQLTLKKVVLLFVIGLAVFLLYLYLLEHVATISMGEIVEILKSVNLLIYPFAFIIVILDTAFYSLAWQHFLLPLSVKVSFKESFLYVWVGTFIDLLIPAEAITGEISKTFLMSKNVGGDTGKVVASIISHRIVSLVITLSTLLIASSSFILRYKLPVLVVNLIIFVTIFSLASLIFLCLLSIKEQIALKIIDKILDFLLFVFKGYWRLTRLRIEIHKVLKVFHQGIESLVKRPRNLIKPIIFSVASWFTSLLVSFLVFVSLGQTPPLIMIAIVHSISINIQTIPLGVPGEVGLMEIIMTSLYASLGVHLNISTTTAAAVTILIRIVNMWFRLLLGFIATQLVGIKPLMDNLQKNSF